MASLPPPPHRSSWEEPVPGGQGARGLARERSVGGNLRWERNKEERDANSAGLGPVGVESGAGGKVVVGSGVEVNPARAGRSAT